MTLRTVLVAVFLGLLCWLFLAWMVGLAYRGFDPESVQVITVPDVSLPKLSQPTTTTAPPTTTTHTHPPKPVARTAPTVRVAAASRPVVDGSVWDRLAACESHGNWSINTGNGYYGGLQFALSSWRAVGGTGYPHEHSREEQIHRAVLLKGNGPYGRHWPACSRKLRLDG